MNPWNKLSLQCASLILTGVSIIFTVLLWGQLPDEGWMKFIAGLAGFALELCKFSLLPMALLLLKNAKTMVEGLILLTLGGALFVVSIGASVTFLENGEQARGQQSEMWQERQTTIKQLDKRIAIGQSAAEIDIENGFRKRGLDTLEQIESWQKKREELLQEPIAQSGGVIGLSEGQRFYAWLLLAILIDGCAVAGWTVLSKHNYEHEAGFKYSNDRTEPLLRTNSAEKPNKKAFLRTSEVKEEFNSIGHNRDDQAIESLMEKEQVLEAEHDTEIKMIVVNGDIIDRIVNGEHGEVLSIRGLMAKEKIGYVKAKKIVDSLEDDGVLMKSDKGYELISNSGEQQSLSYA